MAFQPCLECRLAFGQKEPREGMIYPIIRAGRSVFAYFAGTRREDRVLYFEAAEVM